MAINRIKGPMLSNNLERLSTNLSLDNDLMFFDVVNRRVGINTASPNFNLDVNGTTYSTSIVADSVSGIFGDFQQTLRTSAFRSAESLLGELFVFNTSITSTSETGDLGLYVSGEGKIFTNAVISGVQSPVDPLDAVNKQYVDLKFGNLLITGSTISAYGQQIVLEADTRVDGTLSAINLEVDYNIRSNYSGQFGNLQLQGNELVSTNADGNITIDPNGSGIVTIAGTNGVVLPSGYTLDRPAYAVQGTIRYNIETNFVEFWNGTNWVNAGPETSVITSQLISGDGVSTEFVLEQEATSESILVSINGTLQQPITSYNVIGTRITFAEPPQPGDLVEVRFISVTYTLDNIIIPTKLRADVLSLPLQPVGTTFYVEDGDNGSPCLAVFNGTTWKKVLLTADL